MTGYNEKMFCFNKSLEAREIHQSVSRDWQNSIRNWLSNHFLSGLNYSGTRQSSNYRDKGAATQDLQNSRPNPKVKSLENSLIRLGMPTLLWELDESLEDVKRNKKGKKIHEDFLKSVDKTLQKLSLRYHPDRASNLDSEDTHESQSALNAIRTVLKLLTEAFLENVFIDYKYEYFSRSDINVLVNEKEVNNAIQAVLGKISVLSEIKRMNITGEIRKFLVECEKCVKSCFDCKKNDFAKYRSYALYHLQKNIEGYEKLERECHVLNEECSEENNEDMKAVVQSVLDGSSRKLSVLKRLENVAKRSFKGNFKLFPVDKTMDEYYILPFVDYVNLLSMCNLLIEPRCSYIGIYSPIKDARMLFNKAYEKAYFIYYVTRDRQLEESLRDSLKHVFSVLQYDFRVDAYSEGRSNRAAMHEKLLDLKKVIKDLQETEKNFREDICRYVKDEKEFYDFMNSRHDTEDSFKLEITKRGNESEKESSKCNSLLEYEEEIGEELK